MLRSSGQACDKKQQRDYRSVVARSVPFHGNKQTVNTAGVTREHSARRKLVG